MNKLKPLVAALILLGGSLGAESVSAKNPPKQNPATSDIQFAGVGLGQNQVLGLFLSNQAAPTPTSGHKPSKPPVPKVCNAVAQVVGLDGVPAFIGVDGNPVANTANLPVLNQGETVFIAIPKPTASPGAAPQYYSVSVRNLAGCLGLTATLGVYNTDSQTQTPQDLQLVVPMLPSQQGQGAALNLPPIDQPPTDQPPTDQPPADQPPPVDNCTPGKKRCKPPVDQPPTDQPPVDQPPTDQPPPDQPPADQPPTDNPGILPGDQPPTDQPPVDQPPTDKPPVDQHPADLPPPPPSDQPGDQPTDKPTGSDTGV